MYEGAFENGEKHGKGTLQGEDDTKADTKADGRQAGDGDRDDSNFRRR